MCHMAYISFHIIKIKMTTQLYSLCHDNVKKTRQKDNINNFFFERKKGKS